MPQKKKAPIIQATNLTFVRNGEEIIHHFTFDVHAGDYVGIIGPNGGGKTTLVRLLLGLLTPTQGQIKMLGGSPTDRVVRKQIGYVAQKGGTLEALFPASVEEVIRSGRMAHTGLFGRIKPKDEKAIQHAIDTMNIRPLLSRHMSKLSGGERQKVLLARALVGEPKILFLDEPLDGLDPASREEFYASLRRLNKEGMTILSVSHDVHAMAQEARSAICLKHQLVCHGSKACVIDKQELQDLFHKDRKELMKHHH